jgi:enediyne biosynthesis protein E5
MSTASTPDAPGGSTLPKSKPKFDSRWIAPLLISVILLVGQLSRGVLESYPQTLLAIGCSIAADLALGLLVYRKIPHLASAYVTGISVGILIRSPYYWPFALCGIIAILSKYVIRIKDRHIWNPSNFAISVMLFLAPATVASLSIQWGNSLPPMMIVWLLGSAIIWRLKRFNITGTYVASFVFFALVRSMLDVGGVTGMYHMFLAEVAPITGPMYQLFIFFMITDPKTTVHARWAQCVVAFGVAAAECLFRIAGNVHAPYFALFIVGPIANLIEIAWQSKRQAGRDRATSGAAAMS